MSSKWDENTTLKFVFEYKRHECLWDCKSGLYKNKSAREKAYKDIAGTMAIAGFGVPEVKNKIKNLRSTYCQELKKISMRSKSSPDDAYTPGLKWFKEMDSVLGTFQASRFPSVKNDAEETSDGYLELSDNVVHRSSDKEVVFTKRKPKIQDAPMTRSSHDDDDDELEAFGKYIALQLKKLSTERAIRAKEYIHTYLTQQRLEELHDAPLIARSYASRQSVSGMPYSRSPPHVSKSPGSHHPIEAIDIPHFDFKSEYDFSDSS